jgi:hypothetical protein
MKKMKFLEDILKKHGHHMVVIKVNMDLSFLLRQNNLANVLSQVRVFMMLYLTDLRKY